MITLLSFQIFGMFQNQNSHKIVHSPLSLIFRKQSSHKIVDSCAVISIFFSDVSKTKFANQTNKKTKTKNKTKTDSSNVIPNILTVSKSQLYVKLLIAPPSFQFFLRCFKNKVKTKKQKEKKKKIVLLSIQIFGLFQNESSHKIVDASSSAVISILSRMFNISKNQTTSPPQKKNNSPAVIPNV